jgi:hypothetical protein
MPSYTQSFESFADMQTPSYNPVMSETKMPSYTQSFESFADMQTPSYNPVMSETKMPSYTQSFESFADMQTPSYNPVMSETKMPSYTQSFESFADMQPPSYNPVMSETKMPSYTQSFESFTDPDASYAKKSNASGQAGGYTGKDSSLPSLYAKNNNQQSGYTGKVTEPFISSGFGFIDKYSHLFGARALATEHFAINIGNTKNIKNKKTMQEISEIEKNIDQSKVIEGAASFVSKAANKAAASNKADLMKALAASNRLVQVVALKYPKLNKYQKLNQEQMQILFKKYPIKYQLIFLIV